MELWRPRPNINGWGSFHPEISGVISLTLPKFNMEPKHDGFQKESPFAGCHFQVPC